jgi:polysaccharide biosynthesis protein PslH
MKLQTEERSLKVLVVDEEIPYPPDAGKRIRTWNLLKRLAERHEIHLLCYGRMEESSSSALRAAGIVLHIVEPPPKLGGSALYLRLLFNLFSPYPFSVAKHHSRRFQRALDGLLAGGDWDLLQCEWTPYAQFLSSTGTTPTLIATHNIESQIWNRRAKHSASLVEKCFFGLQGLKMAWFERRALLRATAVTAVTSDDAQQMHEWGVRAVTVVPNGVDPEFYLGDGDIEDDNEILSVASLDWFPNADALDYFSSEIFPLVRQKLPNTVLRVVGRRPPEALKKRLSAIPGIEFVGEVTDVRPYIDRASVIVVPLRIGGGSRLKILEALAAGKAVVSTSIGAEGLGLKPEKHLLIADSSVEFASRVVELLASKETRKRLGQSGREIVCDQFGWNGIAARLEGVWRNILPSSRSRELTGSSRREVQATL